MTFPKAPPDKGFAKHMAKVAINRSLARQKKCTEKRHRGTNPVHFHGDA